MNRHKLVELQPIHFIMAIVLFGVLTNLVGHSHFSGSLTEIRQDKLIELNDGNFLERISRSTSFVLFYVDNSDLCEEMNRNLNQIAEKENGNVDFFKLNVEKYPKSIEGYNVSGTPNIYIFKNGKVYKKIMGIVSVHNLEIICKKLNEDEK